jgi:ATP synthase I chain
MDEPLPTDASENDGPPSERSGDVPAADSFDEATVPRVLRNIVVIGCLFLIPAFWFYRMPGLVGFAFGGVVSYVNFYSLKRGVEGLTDRVANQQSKEKGGLIVLRFLVRYGLVAAVAYAIFMCSALAFRGFLWGLCLPVAALMAEAVHAGYAAFRGQ